ncbi:MAG: magnesium chelatase [Ignavibacteriae bacterium HGW-Ignavibacteriae-4]|jgi:MoxR-like ATPase|nr:MAG: magnesium chelatase [Ignavibacteriae bacterium HGW-Ignavibacteriae-4]
MENENMEFQSRVDLTKIQSKVELIKKEISKSLIGQEQMVELILTAILTGGHVLIEGVPGVAKTLTAKLVSKVINADYGRIQFTPDLMPSDILGTSIYNPKLGEFEFKKGPIFKNLVLIDEINRAPAKTQSALFEVMEEQQISMDGVKYTLTPPFFVMATQNPVEHEGTYRLPEAQLDRFLFKINVDYPSMENELNILKNKSQNKFDNPMTAVNQVISSQEIEEFKALLDDVVVDDVIYKYIVEIIQLSRNFHSVYLGASPRAGIMLLRSAQAFAILNGRDFVTPEDIQTLCVPLLSHRLILTPEKEMEGITTADVIKDLLHAVEVPR